MDRIHRHPERLLPARDGRQLHQRIRHQARLGALGHHARRSGHGPLPDSLRRRALRLILVRHALRPRLRRVLEVARPAREDAWAHNGGLDAPRVELRGAAQRERGACGERVHPGLGREVRRQHGRLGAVDRGRADPDHVAVAAAAHVRQRGLVQALRADHVDVVEPQVLRRGKGLRGAVGHVPRVVDQYVKVAGRVEDGLDGGPDGGLVEKIDGYGPEVGVVRARELGQSLFLGLGVTAVHVHAGEDRVAVAREGAGRQGTEAGRGAGDEHGLSHCC